MATKVTTKKPLFGNRRSHALNATKMHQNPNLQTFTINGEKVKFREVNRYTYIAEDQILYMKDDSLYLYQGKEDFRIARDVVNYYCYDYEYGSSF